MVPIGRVPTLRMLLRRSRHSSRKPPNPCSGSFPSSRQCWSGKCGKCSARICHGSHTGLTTLRASHRHARHPVLRRASSGCSTRRNGFTECYDLTKNGSASYNAQQKEYGDLGPEGNCCEVRQVTDGGPAVEDGPAHTAPGGAVRRGGGRILRTPAVRVRNVSERCNLVYIK